MIDEGIAIDIIAKLTNLTIQELGNIKRVKN